MIVRFCVSRTPARGVWRGNYICLGWRADWTTFAAFGWRVTVKRYRRYVAPPRRNPWNVMDEIEAKFLRGELKI